MMIPFSFMLVYLIKEMWGTAKQKLHQETYEKYSKGSTGKRCYYI